MAVLNKAWGSTDRVSPDHDGAVVTGDTEGESAEAPEAKIYEQPLLIYVTDGEESSDIDKIEKVVLMDDKVCIAMWAFKCIKMTTEQVKADPVLSEKLKNTPGFIVVSRDLKRVKHVAGNKLSAKNLYKTMKAEAGKAYKTKLDKNVKRMLKVLIELDKVNNETRLLSEKEKRLGSEISKGEAAKIAKEREELADRLKKAEEERDELKNFELKPLKA